MFVMSRSQVARLPVSVSVINAAGGLEQQGFQVDIKRQAQAEWDALFARHGEAIAGLAEVSGNLQANADLFCAVVTGWEGVQDEQGPVLFSPAVLRALVVGPDGPALSRGLFAAIESLRFGLAAEKN
ncbi:hypothetical protein QR66_19280 [Chromobacterium piscinae]|nr:hypothetical protein QR66_19280 [Chromobacterium piscinae]